MAYMWNRNVPDGVNEQTWRREQIANYFKLNPQCKPRDIMKWLCSQTPNP